MMNQAEKQLNIIEKEFNALAAEYETNRLSDWYQAHANEMLKHCPDIKEGDILDVGCGTGYFLRLYLKDKPHIRAVGIDASSAMIEAAKKKAGAAGLNQIKFIHANWEELNPDLFIDYRFKAIFCANTFHYFSDPQSATDKLFKQLVEEGTLYLLERNKALSPLTLLWGFIHRVFIKDQVIFYSTAELVRFFEKAGFKQVKTLLSLKKYFWKNKLFTSIVLIEGSKQNFQLSPDTKNN